MVTVTQDGGSPVHAEYSTDNGAHWAAVPAEGIELVDGVNSFLLRTADEAQNYDNEDGTPYTVKTELMFRQFSVTPSVASGQWTNGAVTSHADSHSDSPYLRLSGQQ